MRIHQLGHAMIPGDAITRDTLEIDRRLRTWGFESRIFAGYVHPDFEDVAQTDGAFRPFLDERDDVLLYHYSIYDPNVRLFQAAAARKVLIYHNITPAHFFAAWDRDLAALCDAGRWALWGLRDCELALADSKFNRQELIRFGFDPQRTGVLPVFFSQDTLEATPADGPLLDRLRGQGKINWLSVGRVVPNKRLDDVIRVFGVYHHAVEPHSHLTLVGPRYVPAYDRHLEALVAALGLQDSVTMTGIVPPAALKAYYQAAHLYLCASQHEGFCLPLVESMYFGVPILARKATAVPETLGGAGILFGRPGYAEVAEMAHLMVTDPDLREQVIAGQRERLVDLAPERVAARLRQVLNSLGIFCEGRG